jgi:hypothetical protein
VRVKDKRVLRLVKLFLEAEILIELSNIEDTDRPQGGIFFACRQRIVGA